MNNVILMGRLCRDPEVRYTSGESSMAVARYTLAVDRRVKAGTEAKTDFIGCVSFGKTAEHIEKYWRKGMKMLATGRIMTGSYEKDGTRHYTTDIVVDSVEFTETKRAEGNGSSGPVSEDGFMNIPEGLDEELPFE